MKTTIILIIILVLFLLFLIFNIINKERFRNSKGICVFDIDGTSLQGMENVCYYKNKKYDKSNGGCTAAAIQACKDKNYRIAVNTASNRDRNNYCCSTGFCNKYGICEILEKNWWNNQKYYKLDDQKGSNHGGCGKTHILNKLKQEHKIRKRKNIVLWDDFHENITGANSAGFGVIPMDNLINCSSKYGLNDGIKQTQLDNFINSKIDFTPCKNQPEKVCYL